jgi:hypothetical protein
MHDALNSAAVADDHFELPKFESTNRAKNFIPTLCLYA